MPRHETQQTHDNESFTQPMVTVRMSRAERDQLRSEGTAAGLSMQALCRKRLGLAPEPRSRMHRYGKANEANGSASGNDAGGSTEETDRT